MKKLLLIAIGLFGLGFALVPFYDSVCQVAGINRLCQAHEISPRNTQVDSSRVVTIQFDSNANLPGWSIRPVEASLSVHPGATAQVVYEMRNEAGRPMTARALPGYAPAYAAGYFKKLECFCFSQQTLAPGEARRMPVVFVVDPSAPDELTTITLSYTFFEVTGSGAVHLPQRSAE